MKWVICINNKGYEASLEYRKLYESLSDEKSEKHGFLRVIDESGEDYLYPETMFAPIAIEQSLAEKLHLAA
jgi:hypothetical protein